MKKYFSLLLFALCLNTANAQQDYKVGTEVEKRGVLIEEFTGIKCGNCPDGHVVSESIEKGAKGQVYVVNVHAGHYAGADKSGNSFVTEEGEALVKAFNVDGFPSATINRHEFEKDKFVFFRSMWTDYAKQEIAKDAPINLFVESTYDGKTRELKVHVEGFATQDNSKDNLKLSVILTQDYIIGEQNGAANFENYTHMHILRDYLTDLFGDEIGKIEKGKYFTKDYTYVMPEIEKGVEFVPGNMNVIAFVSGKGMTEILNAKGCKPSYNNLEVEAGAELYSPYIKIGNKYGFNFFETEVRNYSTEKIENATFDITINGVTQNITAKCNIAPFERNYVKIPCKYEFNEKGIAKYEIKLVKLNDMAIDTDVLKGQFTKPNITNENVSVSITTDNCAEENEFMLKDEDGNIIRKFGPFKSGESTKFDEILELEEGKTYCIEITDMYGNGMDKGAKGSLVTRGGTGKLIDQFYKISDYGIRSFFTVDKKLAIDNVEVNNNNGNITYSLNGMSIGNDNSYKGIVISNGKKYIRK